MSNENLPNGLNETYIFDLARQASGILVDRGSNPKAMIDSMFGKVIPEEGHDYLIVRSAKDDEGNVTEFTVGSDGKFYVREGKATTKPIGWTNILFTYGLVLGDFESIALQKKFKKDIEDSDSQRKDLRSMIFESDEDEDAAKKEAERINKGIAEAKIIRSSIFERDRTLYVNQNAPRITSELANDLTLALARI